MMSLPSQASSQINGYSKHRTGQRLSPAPVKAYRLGARRIDRGIEPGRGEERIDVRLNLARELFEHEVLILHLGAELGRLEQPLAVPLQGGDLRRSCRKRTYVDGEPFVQEGDVVRGQNHVLGMFDEAVVLGVEDTVDGGEANVLVVAAVTGHEMLSEQLVITGRGVAVVPNGIVGIGYERRADLAAERISGMGDIGQEHVP